MPYGTGKLPPGMVLGGRYLIVRKIAQGGMGAVYEAKELTKPDQRLALKEMSFSMLKWVDTDQQKAVVESFRREFELLSQLSHPNLVQAFEFFEEQGRQYYVMEYLEGQTLETILENEPQGKFLPPERVLGWGRQLCDVLEYLHGQTPPIIYRDLKPSNIMEVIGSHADSAGYTGVIKLFDFGIARFYKPGQKSDTVRFGTEGYLAPEIAAYHSQTSVQTDIYALGVLLHQLLTRHDPLTDPWRRPGVRTLNPSAPEYVAHAIEHATMLDTHLRTQSAAEMRRELSVTAAQSPVQQAAPIIHEAAAPAPVPLPAPPAVSPQPVSPQPDQPAVQQAPLLDLGRVQRGRMASSVFQVMVAGAQVGQVSTTAAWLTVRPEAFSAADSSITVTARTARLPLTRWGQTAAPADGQARREPDWYFKLPGILRGWLAVHVRYLVPLPRRHQGMINIFIPGGPVAQVNVAVVVTPEKWKLNLGWLITLGLMVVEVFLFLGLGFIIAVYALV